MLTNEGNVTNVTVDLIFTGTYRDDTGVYECSVSNILNAITRNTTLVVQCMSLNALLLCTCIAIEWWKLMITNRSILIFFLPQSVTRFNCLVCLDTLTHRQN